RSGGRRLYGLVGLGYGLDNRPMPYGLETGLGVHLIRKRRVGLDMELVNQTVTDFKKVSRSHLGIRLLPQVGWGTHWGVMAGPTLNFADQTTKIGLYGGLFYRW